MAGPETPLVETAAIVADGGAPDWDDLQSAANAHTRAVIGRLRDLAEIARLHATLTTAGAGTAPAARRALEPGQTWGDLQVIERVGSGRFGDVYRAFDPSLDREVALKILGNLEDAPSDDLSAMVEEGRLAARVRHPNVVTIYGAKRVDGQTGVWMEFIRGRTLEAELAEHGPLDARALTTVATELAGALAAVHAAGLVHRDVKTTNVMRDAGGRIVLGDFGTGRLHESDDIERAGLAGTPPYLAPEIFQGQAATQRSDVYSLGVLLFRLATFRFPVEGRSLNDYRAAHDANHRLSLRALRPGLPRRLVRAIDRALAADPGERFDTAATFGRAVRSAPVSTPSVAIAAAVALAAVAGMLTMLLQPPVPEPAESGIEVVHLDPVLQQTYVLRGPALDGRRIPCALRGNQSVALCTMDTGEIEVLRESGPRGAPGTNAVWPSPDGSRLAYVWIGPTVAVMNVDGTGQRDLYEGSNVSIIRWSEDSDALFIDEAGATADQRIVKRLPVTLPGSPPEELWSRENERDLRPDISPDGRTIVVSTQLTVDERDLTALDVATGEVLWTYEHAGWEGWPRWTPDGQAIVFVSRLGTNSLRLLRLEDRHPVGPPAVVRDMGRIDLQAVGFGADGSYYMIARPPARSSWTVALGGRSAGRALAKRPLATAAPTETMGADWSPDGSHVAYLPGPFGSQTTRGAVTISASLNHRSIPLPGFLFPDGSTVRWSPDGRWLAVLYGQLGGSEVLAVIDLEHSDELTVLVRAAETEALRSPAWAPGSGAIYYRSSQQGEDGSWRHVIRRVSLDTRTQEHVRELRFRAGNGVGPIAVAPDGALAVGVSMTAPADVDPTRRARCVVQIGPPSGPTVDHPIPAGLCTAMAWSRDGARLAIATQPRLAGALWLLDPVAGESTEVQVEDLSRVSDLSFHPSGRDLLLTDGNPRPDLWRVRGLAAMMR